MAQWVLGEEGGEGTTFFKLWDVLKPPNYELAEGQHFIFIEETTITFSSTLINYPLSNC